MAKFDVYRDPDGRGYLLDCQADLLSELNTRFVVPLLPAEEVVSPGARLNPVFSLADKDYFMMTQYAGSIPLAALRERVASLADHDLTIGNALDMLISGF